MNPTARQIALTLRSTMRSATRSQIKTVRNATNLAAKHKSRTIGQVLASASAAKPLKDAVKFARAPADKSTIWTYSDLNRHVNALATGLEEMQYAPSDKILVLLPVESPEYAVTLLAASKLGVSVIVCDPPADPMNVSIDTIADSLRKHQPRALFIGKEYSFSPPVQDDDGAVASVNPIANVLAPGAAIADSRGTAAFVPLTGKAFQSAEHPYLEHVVQTSDANLRGTITFKSLLVYSGKSPALGSGNDPLFVSAATGETVSEAQILTEAEALGSKLGLSANHEEKSGKVVIKPAVSTSSAVAIVSAVMHESLWLSPTEDNVGLVSSEENALVA